MWLAAADGPSGGVGIPRGFEVDEGVTDHVSGCMGSVEMAECFINEACRGLAIAACGAGSFGCDAPACDVLWLQFEQFEQAALAGIGLLNREVAAADARLIREDEKRNALVDEAMHRFFDAGEEFNLRGLADVVDVADECAVTVGEDRELRSGISVARVEPDVFQLGRRFAGDGGTIRMRRRI